MAYCLRWHYNPRFSICPEDEDAKLDAKAISMSCNSLTYTDLMKDSLLGFYLWWILFYYLYIFLALGSYIEQKQYETLWTYILRSGGGIGKTFQTMLAKNVPIQVVQAFYLLIHLGFSCVCMSF